MNGKQPIDMVGQRVGKWTVLRYAHPTEPLKRKSRQAYWWCKCDCGEEREVAGYSLRLGGSTHCGCISSVFVDLADRTFGRWAVLRRAPARLTSGGRFALTYWECRCACGVIKDVRAASLLRGKSTSCGCLRQETVYDALRTHGETVRDGKGGRQGCSTEYRCWQNMLNRCRRPNAPGYRHYGGRGISVAPEWKSFEAFLEDVGRKPSPQHSLDRIDVNLGYFKANCRWATAEMQVANRRKASRQSSEDRCPGGLHNRRTDDRTD